MENCTPMRTSDKGKNIIKEFEELRLEAYVCPAGVLTIGYGHTGKDVVPGMIITEAQAEDLLARDLHDAELAVQREVVFGLAPHQFDALVSLIFNIGVGAFKKSTLLKKLNASDIVGAANEFNKWVFAGGKKLKGLQRRRDKERLLFLTGETR